MYSHRGRGGPPRSTPASVQCQKCLKRGHYSYECKAAPQERPYVPRPSRTQQLLDPKLRPQLTNDTLDTLQKKTGAADAELAKKAAQRAKELKALDDSGSGSDSEDGAVAEAARVKGRSSRRQRSRSYDSVSSAPVRSASPPPRRTSISPERKRSPAPRRRSPSPRSDRSYSASDMSRSLSPRPGRVDDRRREPRSVSRGSRSLSRGSRSVSRDSVRRSLSPPKTSGPGPRQGGHYSSDEEPSTHRSRGGRHDDHDHDGLARRRQPHRRNSRSPRRGAPNGRLGGEREPVTRQYRDRRDPRHEQDDRRASPPPRAEPPRRSPPRERSLSPFSKRLALTQAAKNRS